VLLHFVDEEAADPVSPAPPVATQIPTLEPIVIERPPDTTPSVPEVGDVEDAEDASRRTEFERMVADRIAMQDAISREPGPTSEPPESSAQVVPEVVAEQSPDAPSPVMGDESGEDFGFRAAFQKLAAERGQPSPGTVAPGPVTPDAVTQEPGATDVMPGPPPVAEPTSVVEPPGSSEPDENAGMEAALGLLAEQQEAIRRGQGGNTGPVTPEPTGGTPEQKPDAPDADEFRRAFEQLAAARDDPDDQQEPQQEPSGAPGAEPLSPEPAEQPRRAWPEPGAEVMTPSSDFGMPLGPATPGLTAALEPNVEEEIVALRLQEQYRSVMDGPIADPGPDPEANPESDPEVDPESDKVAPESGQDESEGFRPGKLLERYAPSLARIALPAIARAKELATDAGFVGAPEVASLTFEHGFIKILVSQGLDILDVKIVETNPRLFREGMVSDPRRASLALSQAVSELKVRPKRFVGAAPGYQTNVQDIELPLAGQIDPKLVLPREARRVMGVSAETSHLAWHRLPDDIDNAHWLVMSATKRSVASLTTTAQGAGVKIRNIELRAFALARAINLPDVVIAWSAIDGCDAVVVRDWEPMVVQSAYWGAEPRAEGDVLINRVSEVAERAAMTHAQQNPETPLSDDTPVVVTGTPIAREPEVAKQVAGILRRPLERVEPAMHLPEGFPIDDMVVNVGLALWSA
jgi:hypothetical protein